jgi:hypothetical protein
MVNDVEILKRHLKNKLYWLKSWER